MTRKHWIAASAGAVAVITLVTSTAFATVNYFNGSSSSHITAYSINDWSAIVRTYRVVRYALLCVIMRATPLQIPNTVRLLLTEPRVWFWARILLM